MSIEFLITSLVVTVTPGPGALFTVAAGLARGARAGVVAAVGCTLGTVPHLAAAISGAALVVAASPTAFAVLKWAGVAYLLWMAWSTFRRGGLLDEGDAAAPTSTARTIADAVGLNLLNPKLTLFFFAFLPQFVPAGGGATLRMLGLSGVFMVVTLVVFVGYGVAAAAVRGSLLRRPRLMTWINRVLGVSFLALGARLAVSGA